MKKALAILLVFAMMTFSACNVMPSAVKKSLLGKTYVNMNYPEENIDTEYIFETVESCTVRVTDHRSYDLKVEEKSVSYRIKSNGKNYSLIIGEETLSFEPTWEGSERYCICSGSDETWYEGDPISYVAAGSALEEVEQDYHRYILGAANQSYSGATDDDYISAAKTVVSNHLKNPSTAQYNSVSIYEKDDYGRAIVRVDVSAQNSFGGWARETWYVCIQSIDSSSTFSHKGDLSYVTDDGGYSEETLISVLKGFNDFGEHPNADEFDGYLIEQAPAITDRSVDCGGVEFTRYVSKSKKLSFAFYVDPQDDTVAAATISASPTVFATAEERELLEDLFFDLALAVGAENSQETADVFEGDGGRLITGLQFLNNGFILDITQSEEGTYLLSLVNGRKYGFTEENYWVPFMGTESLKKNPPSYMGDAQGSTNATTPATTIVAPQATQEDVQGNTNATAPPAMATTPQPTPEEIVQPSTTCEHSYLPATCTDPMVCTLCGATAGTPAGHCYAEATCTAPKTCSVCGVTTGSAAGHSWVPATCTKPATCSVCNITSGEPTGHDVFVTKCRNCDYTDFSRFAKTYTDVTAYDAKTGEHYDVQNVSISSSGVLSFSFHGQEYSLALVQTNRGDSWLVVFDCYSNGELVSDATVEIDTSYYYPRLSWKDLDGCYLYFIATE